MGGQFGCFEANADRRYWEMRGGRERGRRSSPRRLGEGDPPGRIFVSPSCRRAVYRIPACSWISVMSPVGRLRPEAADVAQIGTRLTRQGGDMVAPVSFRNRYLPPDTFARPTSDRAKMRRTRKLAYSQWAISDIRLAIRPTTRGADGGPHLHKYPPRLGQRLYRSGHPQSPRRYKDARAAGPGCIREEKRRTFKATWAAHIALPRRGF